MNGAIYARFSCDHQREESIEGQVRECREYAEKNGITIIEVYADRALTGKTDKRPRFQKMIKDSEKRLFEVVLVWKLDRFSRNRYDSATYKTKLKKNGVKVISAKEQISDSPEGIILESMLEGMAKLFCGSCSKDNKRIEGKCLEVQVQWWYNAIRLYEERGSTPHHKSPNSSHSSGDIYAVC